MSSPSTQASRLDIALKELLGLQDKMVKLHEKLSAVDDADKQETVAEFGAYSLCVASIKIPNRSWPQPARLPTGSLVQTNMYSKGDEKAGRFQERLRDRLRQAEQLESGSRLRDCRPR